MHKNIVNAMTVDVEDYFQVSAFEKYIAREKWDNLPCRVERNIDLILSLFSERGVCATFFTLGWIAERHPAMMRRIAAAGHEIASHGYAHVRVSRQDRATFVEDVTMTKRLLEDISGTEVRGYRAASFSIDAENHWAHEELERAGYLYSSSIYPIRHDLYGIPGAGRFHYRPGTGQLLEVPVSTYEWRGHRFPSGGGGYFRLLPYRLSSFMIRRINEREGQSCIFYFHPWEIDPGQPRMAGLDLKTRFRHYNNLNQMQRKLERLLSEFRWDSMQNIFVGSLRGRNMPADEEPLRMTSS